MFCLHDCLCTMDMPDGQRSEGSPQGQKRTPEPLELEVHTFVSCHVGAGIHSWSLKTHSQVVAPDLRNRKHIASGGHGLSFWSVIAMHSPSSHHLFRDGHRHMSRQSILTMELHHRGLGKLFLQPGITHSEDQELPPEDEPSPRTAECREGHR